METKSQGHSLPPSRQELCGQSGFITYLATLVLVDIGVPQNRQQLAQRIPLSQPDHPILGMIALVKLVAHTYSMPYVWLAIAACSLYDGTVGSTITYVMRFWENYTHYGAEHGMFGTIGMCSV